MTKVIVLHDGYAAPPASYGVVALTLQGRSRAAMEAYLVERLRLAREDVFTLAKQVEEECLLGLSELNREPGAEHAKRRGRQAGGGTLTKGS